MDTETCRSVCIQLMPNVSQPMSIAAFPQAILGLIEKGDTPLSSVDYCEGIAVEGQQAEEVLVVDNMFVSDLCFISGVRACSALMDDLESEGFVDEIEDYVDNVVASSDEMSIEEEEAEKISNLDDEIKKDEEELAEGEGEGEQDDGYNGSDDDDSSVEQDNGSSVDSSVEQDDGSSVDSSVDQEDSSVGQDGAEHDHAEHDHTEHDVNDDHHSDNKDPNTGDIADIDSSSSSSSSSSNKPPNPDNVEEDYEETLDSWKIFAYCVAIFSVALLLTVVYYLNFTGRLGNKGDRSGAHRQIPMTLSDDELDLELTEAKSTGLDQFGGSGVI